MTTYRGPNAFRNGELKTPKHPMLITPHQPTLGVYRSDASAFNNRFPKSRYKDQSGGQGGAPAVSGGGGGGSYTAKAVHFDGTVSLTSDAPVAADSSLFTFSMWIKGATPASASQSYLFNIDPLGEECGVHLQTDGAVYFELYLDGSHRTNVTSATGLWSNTWNHLFGYMDLNHPAGQKVIGLFLNAVPIIDTTTDASVAYQMDFGSKLIAVPDNADDYAPPWFVGDFADVWIGQGILETDITIFRDPVTGKPKDPSGFPSSPILFSGDASGFPVNQGTGGTFTSTGVITDAATSPSD